MERQGHHVSHAGVERSKTGRPGIHSSAFRLSQCFAYASARRKPREDKGGDAAGARVGVCGKRVRWRSTIRSYLAALPITLESTTIGLAFGMGAGSLPMALGSVRLLAALFRRAYEKRFEADANKGEACTEAAGLALSKRSGGGKTS